MRSLISTFLTAAALVLTLPLVGCAPSEDGVDDASAALWTEAETLQEKLAATRAEIADVAAQLEATTNEAAEEREAAVEEGAETAPTAEELHARLEELQQQGGDQAEVFYDKVVEYINTSGIIEGQPLTPQQRQAFDWKAEEDIRIAEEYIVMGGDYSRAIEIYNGSLMADPESQRLLDAKAEAEKLQYMDEERFNQVEKGMTQAEVQALLGTVNRRNVREYEEENTVGWFYRREDGAAAGVFFKDRKGEWIVALVDYDAAKPPSQADGAEEE